MNIDPHRSSNLPHNSVAKASENTLPAREEVRSTRQARLGADDVWMRFRHDDVLGRSPVGLLHRPAGFLRSPTTGGSPAPHGPTLSAAAGGALLLACTLGGLAGVYGLGFACPIALGIAWATAAGVVLALCILYGTAPRMAAGPLPSQP